MKLKDGLLWLIWGVLVAISIQLSSINANLTKLTAKDGPIMRIDHNVSVIGEDVKFGAIPVPQGVK